MVILLVLIFFLIGFVSLLPLKKIKSYYILVYSIVFFLFLISAFRGPGVDRDYNNYLKFFYDFNKLTPIHIEPSFLFITWIIKNLFYDQAFLIFVFYALIGIGLKFYAIRQLSEFWLLSLAVYFSYSFILHDMTQIRVGISVSLLLLAIKPLYERRLIPFLVLSILAFLFHYSSIFYFFFWFLRTRTINKKLYFGIIVFSLLLSISNIYITNLLNLIPVQVLQIKILAYKLDQKGFLNVFNSWQLLRIFLCFLFLWKADFIYLYNKYAYLLIKLYVFSACSIFLLADIPVFATRTSDMFAIVDIIVIPFLMYLIKPKIISKSMVVGISFLYLFLNLFYNKIIM